MCRRLLDAVGASLVISSILGLKQQRLRLLNTSLLADGDSETYSVDGAHSLTINMVRGSTLMIMPRR
jgi:hypothetical protein